MYLKSIAWPRTCEYWSELWISLKITKTKSSAKTTQLIDLNFVNSDDISKVKNFLDPTKKTSRAIPGKMEELTNKKGLKDLASCVNECLKQNNVQKN